MTESDVQPRGPDLASGVPLSKIPADGIFEGHVGGKGVLLSRSGDQVFAIASTCTHYGADLADGLVVGCTVRCPWHHACFDLRTGEALAAPAFAALERWHVTVIDGVAFVGEALEPAGDVRPLNVGVTKVVILGGGAAGFAAADQLRRLGFVGDLTIVSADSDGPYDRPNVSKDFLAGSAPAEWMPLKDAAYYEERRIALRLKTDVRAISTQQRQVTTDTGERLSYDALLVATGSEPVRLPTPGFDLPQVHTLRSLEDARSIIERAEGAASAVVIGASFIGLEAAASLRQRGLAVHVVAPDTIPMERVLGPDVGRLVKQLHERNGVVFHLERQARSFDGSAIELEDGQRIPADLVVVGVGVKPRIALAEAAGLKVGDGIVVDSYLRTSVPSIFAAGDVAAYPNPRTGELIRVEHWVVAERQGQVAAANILGTPTPFEDVPFFWSNHYDLSIHYVGRGAGWNRVEVDGEIDKLDFTARYYADDQLLAAATVGRDRESLRLARDFADRASGR